MSIVAAEERQFGLVTCESIPGVLEARQNHGLYVFRFLKSGKPHFVIVDDYLPCQELPDGKPL